MKKYLFVAIILLCLSCEKDSPKTYTCTTYLGNAVYSTATVDKCENCFAPSGYRTTCEEK